MKMLLEGKLTDASDGGVLESVAAATGQDLQNIRKNGFKGTWLLDGGPLPAYNSYDTYQVGTSKVTFHDVTWEDCPSAYYVINFLKKLPMLRMEMGINYTGCIEMSDLGELGEMERKGLLP